MNTKIPEYADILQVLLTMSVVICVGGATLLFLRSGGNRSRRLLSLVMFYMGAYLHDACYRHVDRNSEF